MFHSLQACVTLRSAAIVFVAGWSSFWCGALHIADIVPLWLPLLVMTGGLLMIPIALRPIERPTTELSLAEVSAAVPPTAVEYES